MNRESRKPSRRTVTIILWASVLVAAVGGSLHAVGQDMDKLNRFVQMQNSSEGSAKIFREGRDLIGEENWKFAADKFKTFVGTYPKDANLDAALYWLAFAEAKLERFADADGRLRELLKRFPRSNWADDARALQVQIAPNLGNNRQIDSGLTEGDEEIKIVALQSLFQSNPERGMAYVANMMKPGSTASARMKEAGIEMIRRYGGEQTIPLLIDIIRNDADREIKKNAIHALGRTGNERALDFLVETVRTSQDDELSKAVIFGISRFQNPKARLVLLDIARNGKSREVRKDAIFWLSKDDDEETLNELMRLYGAEQDGEVKKQIVFALKRMGSPNAILKLYEIASSSAETEVRKDALHWIGQRGDAQAVDYLIKAYDTDSNYEIKNQIIFALSRTNQKSAVRKLIDIARSDKSVELRKQAVFWLGRSDDPDAARFLEDLLK